MKESVKCLLKDTIGADGIEKGHTGTYLYCINTAKNRGSRYSHMSEQGFCDFKKPVV